MAIPAPATATETEAVRQPGALHVHPHRGPLRSGWVWLGVLLLALGSGMWVVNVDKALTLADR